MRANRRVRIFLAALSIGGAPLVLEGCDPNVRDTVLSGVQGASSQLLTTFLDAFFESLNDHTDDTQTSTL